jgi:hypothetical protein
MKEYHMTKNTKTRAPKASPVAPKASPAPKAPVKDATMTIVSIAMRAGRSPKVLRAIARNEAYRLSQGKARRLPAPVEGQKHVYYVRDLDAFLKAIAQE